MIMRDVGDISTDPSGLSGAEWTSRTKNSLAALWGLKDGRLLDVNGVNTIVAKIAVKQGFTAYTDGLQCSFVAAETNTASPTININGIGAKTIVDADGDALPGGAITAGLLVQIVFVAGDDHFRLNTAIGVENVTVEGGILLKRSDPGRLAAALGPSTASLTIGSQSFQCSRASSVVVVEGSVSRVTGAGEVNDHGLVVALYVDGVLRQSFTDYCLPSSHLTGPISLSYQPGDTNPHTYEVRASSTVAATYPKGANAIWLTEIAAGFE